MKHPLTQKRFSHRRNLIAPRASTARSKARQSTLTQLDFVSTPSAEQHDSQDSYSDDDFDDRPMKRVKVEKVSTSNKIKDETLTQIGFITAARFDDDDDDEVVIESQYSSQVPASPQRDDTTVREQSTIPSSPLALPRTRHVRILSTPITTRRIEAPSSNTPASAALSTLQKDRSARSRSSSPLQKKSSNVELTQPRKLKRTDTVQDSDGEDVDLVTAFAGGNEHDSYPSGTLFQTQAQYTYDPADAALDRDAARAAWTQALLRKSTIGDSMSDHEEDLVEMARTSSPPALPAQETRHIHTSALLAQDARYTGTPVLRPSQISTVAPTQESPPPLVFTSASTERQRRGETILVESSPLPVPPWSESDAAAWESLDKQNDVMVNPQSLSDFSLPPPPGLFGSSPMFSLHRTSS